MNWEQIEGRWKQLKGAVRSKWGDFTDDDFESIAGKRDVLLGMLQQKYGLAKEHANRAIDEFSASLTSVGTPKPPVDSKTPNQGV